MEFLVMPQFTGSLIECYSGDNGGCPNLTYCGCYGDHATRCDCNNGRTCSCNTGNYTCPCHGVRGPSCTGLRCTIECPVHIGPSSNNPMATI